LGYTVTVMKGQLTRVRRSAGARATLVVALAVLALLVLLPTSSAFAGVDDWQHVWEVIQRAQLLQTRATPPASAMVYYLGDSIARESTINDSSWTRQTNNRAAVAGKSRVLALSVAGHNQTFGMDLRIVRALPRTPAGQPQGILLIGVGISRFIGPPTPQDPFVVDPWSGSGLPGFSPWDQHHYDDRPPLSEARKRELVPRWMDRRWADFIASKRANLDALEALIKTAKAKNLRPVLFDLPLNIAVVGHRLDRPRNAIRYGCRGLAQKYGIKYLGFTGSIRLPSSAYWDLHHLLRPGYKRWQARLSTELVKILPAKTA
jgi:hypothetical protein